MYKIVVIFLLVSVFAVLSPAEPGLLERIKGKGGFMPIVKQPVIVEHKYVVEEQPCKNDKCKPKPPPPDEWPCQSDKCKTCRNECNGNDRCHNDCASADKCRNNCYGNDKCMMDCGGYRPPPPPPPPYVEPDRCRSCSPGCLNRPPLITRCESGKMLYYVQVPKTVVIADFVSNPDLLKLYQESNLELEADGISGRACLNDKTRLDLSRLNAALMPVAKK